MRAGREKAQAGSRVGRAGRLELVDDLVFRGVGLLHLRQQLQGLLLLLCTTVAWRRRLAAVARIEAPPAPATRWKLTAKVTLHLRTMVLLIAAAGPG